MAVPAYKLSDEQIIDKVQKLVHKLQNIRDITNYEASLIFNCVNRYTKALAHIDVTNKWAQEAFKENNRLIELIRERWEAGYKGKDGDE